MPAAALLLAGCGSRVAVAIKATVHTFYAGIAEDDVGYIDDNIAPSASSTFQQHVMQEANEAQHDSAALHTVQIVRIDDPSITGDTARVHVVFADGGSDDVVLVRQGVRWKVVSSGRLG